MDPQEEIAAYLRSKGVQRAVLNDMLRGFAHDLAEAIRTEADDAVAEAAWFEGMREAADLIDPEVPDAK